MTKVAESMIKIELPSDQILSIFDQLDQESKIALRLKLEKGVEERFTQALREIWNENKNKDIEQVAKDVSEAVQEVRKLNDKSSS